MSHHEQADRTQNRPSPDPRLRRGHPPSPRLGRSRGYVGQVGWTIVSREEAEKRRGIAAMTNGEFRMTNASLFFDDLLDAKVREFNPRYAEAEGALLGQWWRLPSSLAGNRDFPFISNTLN